MTTLSKERIIELIETLHEHTMAKEIFVPVLKNMGLAGVKYTGGQDEWGIDVEYYELTEPEKRRSYVGVQFKKGSLVYGAGGAKGTVKEVRNQAETAFEKHIVNVDQHSTMGISRYVVAVTGEINEKARAYIGKARREGGDRGIDYWDGDRLAEYIQRYWMQEFVSYFSSQIEEEGVDPVDEETVVDSDYIEENYAELVRRTRKVVATISGFELQILRSLIEIAEFGSKNWPISVGDLLLEMECQEDHVREEISHLVQLNYLDAWDGEFRLDGAAQSLKDLARRVVEELADAEEDPAEAGRIFDELLGA